MLYVKGGTQEILGKSKQIRAHVAKMGRGKVFFTSLGDENQMRHFKLTTPSNLAGFENLINAVVHSGLNSDFCFSSCWQQ